jgi:hypothetical protein
MNIYGEITKIEPQADGAIRVTGVASTGAIDDADERVLPEAMKAALPAYMRFGALREMHGLTAAGATLKAEVDEDGATRIETLVVDPVAVKKVRLGVYKGFSIGGKVLERDPADHRVITKLKLNEISLVDRPCNPEAVIDVWKASHAEGPTNAEVLEKAEALALAAGRPGRRSQFVVQAREALLKARKKAADLDDDTPSPPPPDDEDRAAGPTLEDAVDQLDDLLATVDPDIAADIVSQLADRWLGQDDDKAMMAEDLAKLGESHMQLARELAGSGPRIDALQATVEALSARLEKLAAEPLEPRAVAGRLRAVGKAEDVGDADPGPGADAVAKYLADLPQEERGRLQLRAALSQPIRIPLR